MLSTTKISPAATSSSKSFARAAVFDAFGRLALALDYGGFVDRPPGESPRLIYALRPVVSLPPLGKGYGQ